MSSDVRVKWLGVPCNVCGTEVNTWDNKCSKALGYKHIVCEKCISKEYGISTDELRDTLKERFGLLP